jgi:OOP family OmpA-OmpF porin
MHCAARPIRFLWLTCAIAAALPAALFAQERPGAVLPPPSLYDSAPPPAQAAPAPRAAEPAPRAAAPAPAPTGAEPAPVRDSQMAPAAAAPAPAAQADAAPPPAPAKEPWYKRWFGGGAKSAQPAAAQPAPAAQMPASGAPAAVGFAGDAPQRSIRTGAGQCLKTGTWDPSQGEGACPDAEPVARAAPAPMAAPPAPQPVEVEPLATPQLKEERALEPEAPSLPPPPTPEPPLAAEPPPAPLESQTLTLSADALFGVGSYELKPSARAALDDLVARLKEVTFQSITITGHTDPTGSSALNDRLSLQRAEEVKRYLVAHGVSAAKIETEGLGSSMPMVIERDCARLPRDKRSACYQPDRRVEIEVTGASERLAGQ